MSLLLSVLLEREEERGDFTSRHSEIITLAGLTMVELQEELKND